MVVGESPVMYGGRERKRERGGGRERRRERETYTQSERESERDTQKQIERGENKRDRQADKELQTNRHSMTTRNKIFDMFRQSTH